MSRTRWIVCCEDTLSQLRTALAMKSRAVSQSVVSPQVVWKYQPGVSAALAALSIHARQAQEEILSVLDAAVGNGDSFVRWDNKASVMAAVAAHTLAAAVRASRSRNFTPSHPQAHRPPMMYNNILLRCRRL